MWQILWILQWILNTWEGRKTHWIEIKYLLGFKKKKIHSASLVWTQKSFCLLSKRLSFKTPCVLTKAQPNIGLNVLFYDAVDSNDNGTRRFFVLELQENCLKSDTGSTWDALRPPQTHCSPVDKCHSAVSSHPFNLCSKGIFMKKDLPLIKRKLDAKYFNNLWIQSCLKAKYQIFAGSSFLNDFFCLSFMTKKKSLEVICRQNYIFPFY